MEFARRLWGAPIVVFIPPREQANAMGINKRDGEYLADLHTPSVIGNIIMAVPILLRKEDIKIVASIMMTTALFSLLIYFIM